MPPFATANPNPGNSGTILGTFTFPEFSNLVQKEFVQQLPQVPLDAKPLFIDKYIGMNQGDVIQLNEFDFTTYAADMPEGTNAIKADSGIGYHKQVYWWRYGLEADITYKERATAQWMDVLQRVTSSLVQTVPQRINLDMTHHITFGNAVSYVDQDGFVRDVSTGDTLSLFNAAHTLAFSPLTYSNIVPGNPQFSKPALEAAELLASTNILDNFGRKRVMKFTHIWFADNPTVENDVRMFIRSTADPVQANSGVINNYEGKYKPLKLSLLATNAQGNTDSTKLNWWGIAALSGVGGERWQAYNAIWEAPRMKPMPSGAFSTTNAEDVHNDNWTFGVRGTCNQAALSGRGIIASLAV